MTFICLHKEMVWEYMMTRFRRQLFCCFYCPCSFRSAHKGTDSAQFSKNVSKSRILLLLGQCSNDTTTMLVFFLATCLLLLNIVVPVSVFVSFPVRTDIPNMY